MLWRKLQLRRRAAAPFFNSFRSSSSFQAASSSPSSPENMETGFVQKALDLGARAFCYPNHRIGSLSTPGSPSFLFGFLQHTHFVSRRSCKTWGALPEHVDRSVLDQCGLPSPTPAADMTPGFHSTLLHSASFLRMFQRENEEQEVESAYALLVLNHDLPLMTLFLWRKACCRICADGGANQIYDHVPSLFPNEDPTRVRECYKPDVIKGDLDSIRPEVKEFYLRLGTLIFDNSDDQDTTDLWKCVDYAVGSIHEIRKGRMKLLVLGALGGRLDHQFANVNTLYVFREVRIILLSDESMAFLLPRGYKHEIKIDSSLEGPYCGLVPLGEPSSCTTTTGLKWDLNKSSLQFGGLISTSNMPVADCVTVSSDTDLIWTISLEYLHSQLREQVGSINLIPF